MNARVLDTNVLVLNRFYMPIRVVNVRRALTLLYRECAEVIDCDDGQYVSYDFGSWCELSQLAAADKQPGEEFLKAVDFEVKVPRIARLTRFDRMPAQTVRFNRRNLFARDEYRCQYCGKVEPVNKLSLDHVVPRSHGGATTWENIVCSCLRCNSRKGGRTPQQARMKLLTNPAKPRFNPLMTHSIDDPRYESWKTFLQTS
ncbi:HNH endonuclease [Rhodopirellula sp. SWK7]|uniref:HNH endonuclease n=1 Tax=Rhodopirellula sp. SWK7 TaxID=595460 RepID=UPI0002BF4D76|nr:HNH endonuclease [Rhodopirellula sp. SWK7]EMI44472.1 HNH endonuclease family protein [Rhodopirellula sp. SWK7]